jgi:hypothetical protein
MFFQEATPDTSGYMIAGYVITFVILGMYVVSMILRNRNYQQDISMLEEMEKESSKVQVKPVSRPAKKAARPGTKKGRK